MSYYICLAKGQVMNRALYYARDLGRRRIYRQNYPLIPEIFNGKDITKGLRLYTYKKKENAQKLCDDINERTGDNFEPVEIESEAQR